MKDTEAIDVSSVGIFSWSCIGLRRRVANVRTPCPLTCRMGFAAWARRDASQAASRSPCLPRRAASREPRAAACGVASRLAKEPGEAVAVSRDASETSAAARDWARAPRRAVLGWAAEPDRAPWARRAAWRRRETGCGEAAACRLAAWVLKPTTGCVPSRDGARLAVKGCGHKVSAAALAGLAQGLGTAALGVSGDAVAGPAGERRAAVVDIRYVKSCGPAV